MIGERFGGDCVPARARIFGSRARNARNAQEAHEAIRPTGFGRTPEAVARHLDRDASRLYGLIWRRALASQMAAARVERVRIELAGEDGAVVLAGECSAMVFDGHFRIRAGGEASGEAGAGAGERNKHSKDKLRAGRGAVGKTTVAGAKDRATGTISAAVVESTTKATLHRFVKDRVAPGAKVYTDEAGGYQGLPFDHQTVNHSVGEYVRKRRAITLVED